MQKEWVTVLVMFGCLTQLNAQIAKAAIHLAPNGKGWGVEAEGPKEAGTSGNNSLAATESVTMAVR
jgi:hypothetical protein